MTMANSIPTSGMVCPKCKANGRNGTMIPMRKGNGLRCNVPGNVWKNGKWTICGNSVFLKTQAQERKVIERPTQFPTLKTPTKQQTPIREWFATNKRQSRLLIVNAGPGCGKTTTVSWAAEAALQRMGTLREYPYVAFNTAARDIMLSKLPEAVSDIFTMNGLGMRIQGYTVKNMDNNKIKNNFKEQTKFLPREERPHFTGIDSMIDKMRAWGLYAPTNQTAWWETTIRTIAERYQMLSRDRKPAETLETWNHYVPALTYQSLQDSRKIDFAEQWSRPVITAMAKHNIILSPRYVELGYEFTDADIDILANVVRKVSINSLRGIVIDEAQDLSLCQIIFYMAMVYNSGEMTVIGDDRCEDPYKAGQGIYAWRGAFSGSMNLIQRLWKSLTGETAVELPLSQTHRCAPEVVESIRPLNSTLESTRSYGNGFAYQCAENTAFALWCGMPEYNDEGKKNTALWIVRTNKAAAKIFIETIKSKTPVCYRGGDGFDNKVNWAFSMIAGYPDSNGEYNVNPEIAKQKLKEHIAEFSGGNESVAAEMTETFILAVMDEAQNDPTIFTQVDNLPPVFTLGNLKRFILAFAAKDAARTVSNVYRCKGDEATWAFVSDTEQFNTAWGNDEHEAAACRLVACSRAINGLITTGPLKGVTLPNYSPGSIEISEEKTTVKQRGDIRLLAKIELTKVSTDHYTFTHYNILKQDKTWNVYDGDDNKILFSGKLNEVRNFLGRM